MSKSKEEKKFGKLYEEQRREAIDEDYRTIPLEVLKREFKAVDIMDETTKPPTRLEQKTAFTIDLYINNLGEEVNKSLGLLQTAIINPEFEKFDITPITSDWNKLVVYIKSFDRLNNISIKDKETIWLRLTDEISPNLAQLIASLDNLMEETGYPYVENYEFNQLLELETNIQNKQFLPIKGISKQARKQQEDRERDARRLGEKDAREIENFIRKGGEESKEDVLKRAFSHAEIEEIKRKLDEIKGLTDENQRKNLRQELEQQLLRRLNRGRSAQFFGESLAVFKRNLKSFSDEQLRRKLNDLQERRDEAINSQDLDLETRLTEYIKAVNDQILRNEGVDEADLIYDVRDEEMDAEDLERELYEFPPSSGTSTATPSGRSTISSSSSSSIGRPAISEIDVEARPPARRGRMRGRGRSRPLLNRVFEGDNSATLGRYQKNRVHLPFDDMNNDPYFILKKMNIH